MIIICNSSESYPPEEKGQEQKRVFDTASRYHLIHTLAILGLPLCRKPYVVSIYKFHMFQKLRFDCFI